MLHILFLVLKIIGIILLVILGITLTLVGVVLFVPIRYRLKTETTNGMKGLRTEAKATWLSHLISAYVTYQENKLDWQVRIGWKKIHTSEEDVDIEENEEETTSNMETDSCEGEVSHKESDSKKNADEQPKQNWIEKIKCTIRGICDKIKKIRDFLIEETHIQAFLRLRDELIFFIKKIRPDKIKGYIRFGLEDPYNTGRALAVLSVLYPFYEKYFQIYPEFENEILEGDIFIKGRIHLIHLLIVVCKLYFDGNVKKACKSLKAIKS